MAKTKRRRTRGEGSVSSKPNRDGLYRARLTIGRSVEGKRVVREFYGHTPQEALAKMNVEKNRLSMNIPEPIKETVAEYLERWLRDTVRGSTKPRTHEFYERISRNHVIPYLGHIPVAKMTPAHVKNFLTELEKKVANGRTRQMAHGTLRKAFNVLVEEGALQRSPVEGVKAPRAAKKPMKTWTVDELNAFLVEADKQRLGGLFTFLACTGMRLGEALALQWSEVDKDYKAVHLSETLVELKGKILGRDELKTDHSKRRVSLDEFGAKVLVQQRARLLKDGLASSIWVFPNTLGKPQCTSEARKQFLKAIRASGIPRIRIHDLRHTHATLLLKNDLHPKIVQSRLGHSSITVTLDLYSHVSPSMDQLAADAFGSLMKKEKSSEDGRPVLGQGEDS